MRTLILNVDRDDDFGRKAGVQSPIVGFKDNVEAANKLGQADPEDSDLNAIFSAISTYNALKKDGKNAEIATICGDIRVGFKSDEILARQLEEVIAKTNADDVILVSDGAEDESILPIVQSRIKITSVKRVSIKQSKELEDAYYRILKLLDDEKVQKQFVLPIALVLIVWAIFALLGMASSGFGAILLTLGAYLLVRVFRWERNIMLVSEEIKSGFLAGKLSIYTNIIAIVILLASFFFAYTATDFDAKFELLPILTFATNMMWGLVIAGLLVVFGRVVDTYVKDRKSPFRYWIAPFSILSFGFIFYSVFNASSKALVDWPARFDVTPFFLLSFVGYAFIGIMIGIIGLVTNHFIKDMHDLEKKREEIEEQTKKIVEKT